VDEAIISWKADIMSVGNGMITDDDMREDIQHQR
jgi:hypothetical protein